MTAWILLERYTFYTKRFKSDLSKFFDAIFVVREAFRDAYEKWLVQNYLWIKNLLRATLWCFPSHIPLSVNYFRKFSPNTILRTCCMST